MVPSSYMYVRSYYCSIYVATILSRRRGRDYRQLLRARSACCSAHLATHAMGQYTYV